jgi:hypothetical protein
MSNFQYDFSLCIPQSKKALKDRFLILKHTKTYFEEFSDLFKKAQLKQFGKQEVSTIEAILKDEQFQFSEIDRGLLFAFSLNGKINDLKPELLSMLRISNDFPPRKKEDIDKAFIKKLAIDLAKFDVFLPALRAKLVVWFP